MFRDSYLPDELGITDYLNREDSHLFTYKLRDVNNVSYGFVGIQINGKMSLYDIRGNIILIKIDGCLAWCSMGDQKYHSPQIWIGVGKPGNIFEKKFEIKYNRKTKKFLKAKIEECIKQIQEKR